MTLARTSISSGRDDAWIAPVDSTASGGCGGGCNEGSAPCGGCGVAKSDTDHQRATWARFVADAKPGLTEFWRTAIMADAFFQADAGGEMPYSDSPLARAMQMRQDVISASSQFSGQLGTFSKVVIEPETGKIMDETTPRTGPDGLGDLMSPDDGGMNDPKLPADGGMNDPKLPPVNNPVGSGKTCCLVKFEYPVAPPTFILEHLGGGTNPKIFIGWEFEVLAIFKKTGVDPETKLECSCDCCEFRQSAQGTTETRDLVSNKAGDGLTEGSELIVNKPMSGEDCSSVKGKDGKETKVCYGKRSPYLAYSKEAAKEGRSHEVYVPPKTGEPTAQPPGLRAQIDAALKGTGESSETVCVYYMYDRPGVEVTELQTFLKDVCYTGEIWSTCPETLKPPSKKFRLSMHGQVNSLPEQEVATPRAPFVADAKGLDIEWFPKGTPQYIIDCKPPK